MSARRRADEQTTYRFDVVVVYLRPYMPANVSHALKSARRRSVCWLGFDTGPDLAGGSPGAQLHLGYGPVEGPRPGGQINSVSVKGLLNCTTVNHRAE